MATSTETTENTTIELAPSFTIPLVLIIGSIPLVLIQKWLGLAIAIFGGFLLFQALTLRLYFTATALDICRGKTLIRNFPYQDWLNWEIYNPTFPVLLYFREVKSIHFLPILFDPKTLQSSLEQKFPKPPQPVE
jgi:hypothetical protein